MSLRPVAASPLRRLNWRAVLDVIVSIVMLSTAAMVIWNVVSNHDSPSPSTSRPLPVPTERLTFDSAPVLGAADARVVMVIFSDFECPYCAQLAVEVLPALKRKYVDSGKVRFAFRHLPLPGHARAIRAAESAECARQQGRFWVMHDSLFEPPMRLDEPAIEAHARKAGLDLKLFTNCMTGAATGRVAADAALAKDLGFLGTPTVIVGLVDKADSAQALEVIAGAQPIYEFRKVLDRALARAGN